jgi:hypothetical protein
MVALGPTGSCGYFADHDLKVVDYIIEETEGLAESEAQAR